MGKDNDESMKGKIEFILDKIELITAILDAIGDFLTLILSVIAIKELLQED